jgi:hypothetical protein
MIPVTEMQSQKRGRLSAMLLALVLLALIPAGYFLFLREPAPPPPAPVPAPAPPPPAAGPPELRLSKLDGEVFVRKKGADGGWLTATVGQKLEVDDEIRTTPSSAVEFGTAGAYTFRVEPGTVLDVEQIEAKVSQFLLEQGMVNANVATGGHVKVRGGNSDAVASSKGGIFSMTNSGQGTVAVGSTEGEVEFSAAGKAVIVRKGQSSIAQGLGAPSAPRAIPPTLFLKVVWPDAGETNKRKLTIAGKTMPGAHVVVGSSVIPVDKDGRFRGVVTLREGHNSLDLTSRDVGGHTAESNKRINVHSTAPQISTDKLPWEKR